MPLLTPIVTVGSDGCVTSAEHTPGLTSTVASFVAIGFVIVTKMPKKSPTLS